MAYLQAHPLAEYSIELQMQKKANMDPKCLRQLDERRGRLQSWEQSPCRRTQPAVHFPRPS
ncbi:hypothetical protein E2562_031038 [Oryza meyeriana var. granulata]|uniref:Uncharacterized protein n=1 Tax=Oryza meyeriana var. granulata TaxID=110450 RepID=A0A6G1FEE5_9ORYZ|nr:hypothetical protein E2562_031038 [Oryza meyeriana var. granulata]